MNYSFLPGPQRAMEFCRACGGGVGYWHRAGEGTCHRWWHFEAPR